MKKLIVIICLLFGLVSYGYTADPICPDCPRYTQTAIVPYAVVGGSWFTGIVVANPSNCPVQCALAYQSGIIERCTIEGNSFKIFVAEYTGVYRCLGTSALRVVVVSGSSLGVYSYYLESYANE